MYFDGRMKRRQVPAALRAAPSVPADGMSIEHLYSKNSHNLKQDLRNVSGCWNKSLYFVVEF